MAWLELHQNLPTHHKTKALKRLLKIPTPHALGILNLLWLWALDHASDGDVSRFVPVTLADVCEWDGDPEALIAALVGAGFIEQRDGGHFIHDWFDYAGKLVELRRKDAERKRNGRGSSVDVRRTSTGHPAESIRNPNPNHDHDLSPCSPNELVPFEEGQPPIVEPDPEDLPEARRVAYGDHQADAPRRAEPAPKPKKTPRRHAYSAAFEAFWATYPGGGSKIKAYEQWLALGLDDDADLQAKVVAGLDAQIADRTRANGGFYPEWADAERWIKHQRWTDKLRYSNIVPIDQKPEDRRETWLKWARGINPNARHDQDRLEVFVERALKVNGLTVDHGQASRILAERGLDEALIFVQQRISAEQALRKETANG